MVQPLLKTALDGRFVSALADGNERRSGQSSLFLLSARALFSHECAAALFPECSIWIASTWRGGLSGVDWVRTCCLLVAQRPAGCKGGVDRSNSLHGDAVSPGGRPLRARFVCGVL